MKKFLMVFGAIALVGVLLIAGAVGWASYRTSVLGTEGKAFVDGALPAITRNWNQQELLDRAAPELKAKAPPAQLSAMFATLAKLGPMLAYEAAKGSATVSYTSAEGSVVTATYVAKARCENGTAVFKVILLKREGHWLILNFHVDPEAAESSPVKHT